MVPRKLVSILTVVLGTASVVHAQHAHDPAAAPEPHQAHPAPAHPGVLGIPMTRHGSGTAWLPDASPMRAAHLGLGGWDVMLHGNLFVGYIHQGSEAGDDAVVSQNWLMAMAGRPLAGGRFEARVMLSFEPLTVGAEGYPLLMQTGETYQGEPLIDRQHPHDLWMELAGRYARELRAGLAFELYAGLAGEPALGPVAYPHRPAAMADPLAPLSHHWQDSSHITFGVVTAGLFTRTAKLEASWFNGREPDEARYDLDLRALDSVAVRLSVNPSPSWSVQGSYGYLASPEEREPDTSVQRVSVSALHAASLGTRGVWTSSAIWGRSIPSHGPATDSLVLEGSADQGRLGVTFARAEYVVKTGHDFGLPEAMDEVKLPVGALSLGHVHPIGERSGIAAGLGLRGSIGYVDADLEPRYGTRTPLGFMVYLQVQPAVMRH